MIHLAAIPSPSQNVIEIGPLTVHFYGILIALGVVVAIIVSRGRFVRFGGSADLFEKVAIWSVIIGFLGLALALTIYAYENHEDLVGPEPIPTLPVVVGDRDTETDNAVRPTSPVATEK